MIALAFEGVLGGKRLMVGGDKSFESGDVWVHADPALTLLCSSLNSLCIRDSSPRPATNFEDDRVGGGVCGQGNWRTRSG